MADVSADTAQRRRQCATTDLLLGLTSCGASLTLYTFGGAITLYKDVHSPRFYSLLAVSLLLPTIPASVLQLTLDPWIDATWGAPRAALLARGIACFSVIAASLVLAPLVVSSAAATLAFAIVSSLCAQVVYVSCQVLAAGLGSNLPCTRLTPPLVRLTGT